MVLWSYASMVLGSYVIVKKVNIPLIIQPQSMGTLCALCAAQHWYFDKKVPFWKVSIIFFALASIAAGIEVGLVFAARTAEDRGITGFTTFLGILATLMINGGFLPQIWTSWKYKEVFGISFIFLGIDALGGIVSAISLAFSVHDFDILACISYIGPPCFELILFAMALYLNPIARRKRLASAEATKEGSEAGDESCLAEVDQDDDEGRIEETLEEKRLREQQTSSV